MTNKPTTLTPQTVKQDGVLAKPGDEIGMLCLTAGSAATLKVREGYENDSGNILLSLKAAANESVCLPLTGPISFPEGAYLELTGAGSYVSFAKY